MSDGGFCHQCGRANCVCRAITALVVHGKKPVLVLKSHTEGGDVSLELLKEAKNFEIEWITSDDKRERL
jgi:hypothetical protein